MDGNTSTYVVLFPDNEDLAAATKGATRYDATGELTSEVVWKTA